MIEFVVENYLWVQGLHIAFVIAWMAGMLYLPRLFVYHAKHQGEASVTAVLMVMEEKLLRIIMNPALIATWVLASLMIIANPALWSSGWFHVKLLLVLIMSGLHGALSVARKKFACGENPLSETHWRFINEAPALIGLVVVILAVTKPF
jgi:protoporphyrinogen IX oxidase